MKTIINELNQAVALLEQFSVSGKLVDLMATAKNHIYAAQDIANGYVKEADAKAKRRAEKKARDEAALQVTADAAAKAAQEACECADHAESAANIAEEAEINV